MAQHCERVGFYKVRDAKFIVPLSTIYDVCFDFTEGWRKNFSNLPKAKN